MPNQQVSAENESNITVFDQDFHPSSHHLRKRITYDNLLKLLGQKYNCKVEAISFNKRKQTFKMFIKDGK